MQKQDTQNSVNYGWKTAIIFIVLVLGSLPSLGELQSLRQSQTSFKSPFSLEIGNYVVAGVFRYFENAVKYSDYLYHRGYETKYGYYPAKGYYYVYLQHFPTFDQAKTSCLRFRKDRELKEAWVFTIHENNISEEIVNLTYADQSRPQLSAKSITIPQDKPPTTEFRPIQIQEPEMYRLSPSKVNHYFYFKAFDIRNHSELSAKIEIIDPEKLQLLSMAESNKLHKLERLTSANNSLLMISQCFGYRRVEQFIDLNNILASGSEIKQKGDTVLVDFELTRLKTGDVATMFNVYFFSNSAIMRPESRYEINQLLEMLKENENYKIKIHGHTNGNNYGPIIKMKDDETNFFELSRNNKESKGSAKELSKERANTIYRYLVFKGIEKKRMQTMGWGGKKMLYEPTDSNARLNVRVEIEILDD